MKEKGRLRPGNIFFVDLKNGRVLPDKEMKEEIVGKRRYRRWLEREKLTLADFVEEHKINAKENGTAAVLPSAPAMDPSREGLDTLLTPLRAFGYTVESLDLLLVPMISTGADSLGSMGNDTPLAMVSNRPKLVFEYFKQLFAQVMLWS